MFFDTEKGVFSKTLQKGLLFFITLFPFIFYPGFVFSGTSSRAINLLFFVAIFGIWWGVILLTKGSKLSVLRSPITVGLGVFFLVLCISGVVGVDFSVSFWSKATRTSGLFYLFHLGIFYLFLTSVFVDEKKQRQFLGYFLGASALLSIGALLGKEGFNLIFTSKMWKGFTIGNSTFAAMYLFAAFLIAIYYILSIPKEKKRWWKNLFPIVFILNPFFISQDALLGNVSLFKNPAGFIGSANASTFVVLISVVLLVGAWVISKIKDISLRNKVTAVTLIVGGGVFVWSIVSLLSPGGLVRDAYLKQSTATRPLLWELSQKAIDSRPLFGWGGDNFDRALQAYYDNRILEESKGGEGWFDRAHNIFIDQAIDTGYIGVTVYILVYLVIFYCLFFVVFRGKNKKDVQLAVILVVYFVGHILELQTAFETTISYVALVIMVALASVLYVRVRDENFSRSISVSGGYSRTIGGVLIVLLGWGLLSGTLPITRAERTNGFIAKAGTSEKRIPLYKTFFSSPLDRAALLHNMFFGLEQGISLKPAILSDQKKRDGFVKEFEAIIPYYKQYIEENPSDYRAHLEFAELYIYIRLFDVDHLDEAHKVIDRAIEIVPQTPQAYWMKAVAYLYQAKFKEAREWADKAYAINPSIEESKRVVDYINRSIKEFPEMDLFSFKKI